MLYSSHLLISIYFFLCSSTIKKCDTLSISFFHFPPSPIPPIHISFTAFFPHSLFSAFHSCHPIKRGVTFPTTLRCRPITKCPHLLLIKLYFNSSTKAPHYAKIHPYRDYLSYHICFLTISDLHPSLSFAIKYH